MMIMWILLSLGETYYLPHFATREGQWQTQMTLTNPTAMDLVVGLHAFDNDGHLLQDWNENLGPNQTRQFDLNLLLPSGSVSGWIQMECESQNLSGMVQFTNLHSGATTSLPLERKVSKGLVLPLLINEAETQSGFVLTNVTDQQQTISMKLFDISNPDLLHIWDEVLEPNGKLVRMVQDFDLPFESHRASLKLESEHVAAAFGLTFVGDNQIVAVPSQAYDPQFETALAQDLSDIYGSIQAAGVQLGISKVKSDPVMVSAGYADIIKQAPMAVNELMEIGSITKSFTAALLLLLQEQNQISLDDRISDYVSGVPNGEKITLRMLLNHTSGLFNYTHSHSFAQKYWYALLPTSAPSVQELLGYAFQEDVYFEPGQGYTYSNTGYLLAGMVIEQVTGKEFGQALEEFIFQPLDLDNTYLGAYHMLPHRAKAYAFNGAQYRDVTELIPLTWGGAAGAILSTSEDVMKWGSALFRSKTFLSEESRRQMMTGSAANPDYGLGLVSNQVNGYTFWGHNGSTRGAVAALVWIEEVDVLVSALVNALNDQEQFLDTYLFTALPYTGVSFGDKHKMEVLPIDPF